MLTDIESTEKSVKIHFEYVSGTVNVGEASRFGVSLPLIYYDKANIDEL